MPPAAVVQGISPNPDQGLGVSLMLGTDYENKKHKLNQELQLDYQHYIAKKKDLKPREALPQPQGLSLPINEKISAQEKLREERSKEYNLFLRKQAQLRGLRRETPPVTSKPGQVQASDAERITSPASPLPISTHNNQHPPSRERPRSRRDAATLTESLDNAKRTGTRRPAYQGRRRWQIYHLKEPYSSEEELSTDREEEFEFKHRRRRERHTPERDHRANRAPLDTKEVEDPGVDDQNNNEWVGKSDPQMPDSMRTAARPRPATSQNKAEFATGLMIGAAEEQTASQIRKEQYRRELLKQIAEQQINKMREKKLELRVAATGATDPEKQPDRIKQFGAVNRQYDDRRRDVPYKPGMDLEAAGKDLNLRPKEDKPNVDTDQRASTEKPHMDNSGTSLNLHTGRRTVTAAQGVPLLDYFNEVYHRDFSNTLGDLAIPRVAAAPPPAPPTVANNYKTPHDAAYYYYGTRNPLDPTLPYSQNGPPEALQQPGNFHSPRKRPPPLRPAEAADQRRSSPLHVGELPEEKAKQRRESALIYQEALRQQIKEREERKRREKEERERYDTKKEAEMMAYNPWGKSGGGAPIKDQKGNLVSDLNQMHRLNEESYRNPVSRNSGQTQIVSTRDGDTPRAEARAALSHQISGFGDEPTPQQLRMQSRYKEDLERQIEENKRKQEEERERMRAEEEKEEKRLADQRARMQQGYDEERRRQEKVKVTAQAEARAPLSHRTSGFGDQPTLQQLHMQSRYKEDLKRQIEENKRKQEEERERMRAEEEKGEKRLADQRARMQRGYDEEQRRQEKVKLHRLEKQSLAKEPETQHTKEEKWLREEQEIEKKVSDSARDGEEKREQLSNEREPSPPIPTLQRRQTNLVAPRPPSVVSQLSSRTDRSVSAPHRRQVPVKPPQPQDRQQEVIRELSALRRYLRKEQRQLETQLDQADQPENHSTPPNRPRGRPRVDAFESVHKRDVRPSTRSPSSAAERLNVEHFREFNQLKYRDTASREEVRHMFPDPPADAQSLDIQQQALLRKQQRKIRLMKREDDDDVLEQRLSSYLPEKNKPGHYIHRDSNLPSETAFIDFYSGDGCEKRIDEQRRLQASAEHWERTAPRRRHDEGVVSINQRNHSNQADSQSLRPESKVPQRKGSGDHSSRSEVLPSDEVDVSSLCSALERRVSVDTVATDPWLRPGTSDAAKRSGCGEKPTIRTDTPPWLTHRVT